MPALKGIFNRIKNLWKSDVPKLNGGSTNYALQSYLSMEMLGRFENPNNFNEYCIDYFSKGNNFASQYDYISLINEMQQQGILDDFINQCQLVNDNYELYMPSPVHGIDHTNRVVFYAVALCMLDNIPPYEKKLILTAARFHDIGRGNDENDTEHGFYSVQKIDAQNLLKDYSPREQNIIKFAIKAHSFEPEQVKEMLKQVPRRDRKIYKKILDYLQDADKLDRTRIANRGLGLDPKRLEGNTAKKLVKVAHQNYYGYEGVLQYVYQSQYDECTRVDAGDTVSRAFDIIRANGYNMSFRDFQNIVAEYKDGTLEQFMSQGNVFKIFSYESFKKFRKEESFDERLSPKRINPEELYSEVARANRKTTITRTSFDSDFMLYYHLKKNNPEGLDLLLNVDLDISDKAIIGIANLVSMNDLEHFRSKGYFFRVNDLFRLTKNLTPEEYRRSLINGDIETLISSKCVKDEQEIQQLKEFLENNGINIGEKLFKANFRLIQEIVRINPQILKEPNVSQYSLYEIFSALTKLDDAQNRIIDGKSYYFEYDNTTVLDLLDYSRHTRVFDEITEQDQLTVTNFFATARGMLRPAYIANLLKKNKPYEAEHPYDRIYYIDFCANKIINDPDVTLEAAKTKMIHAMFDIDIPTKYYKKFEKEFLESLYFHKKYNPDSTLETEEYRMLESLRELFETKNIKEFKRVLAENKDEWRHYNTSNIMNCMRYNIAQASKKDIVDKLQETSRMLDEKETQFVTTTTGRLVKAKILNGENFYIASSTIMANCSGIVNRIREECRRNNKSPQECDKLILDMMRKTRVSTAEICVTINSHAGVGNAASALEEHELRFGYVPEQPESIGLVATNDLSTIPDKYGKRTSSMPAIYRKTEDLIDATTEEHNEANIRGLYPRYIYCYDEITDIAVEKQQELERLYKEIGVEHPIEIVLIKSKDVYIPRIKTNVHTEHDSIKQKLENNEFSDEDFKNMFEKHESNFLLRTLNALHSMSYRSNVWDGQFAINILESYAEITRKIADIVSPEKARIVLTQVETLLERSRSYLEKENIFQSKYGENNREPNYGERFYDKDYSNLIPQMKLFETRGILLKKTEAYEQSEKRTRRKRNYTPTSGSTCSRITRI